MRRVSGLLARCVERESVQSFVSDASVTTAAKRQAAAAGQRWAKAESVARLGAEGSQPANTPASLHW